MKSKTVVWKINDLITKSALQNILKFKIDSFKQIRYSRSVFRNAMIFKVNEHLQKRKKESLKFLTALMEQQSLIE